MENSHLSGSNVFEVKPGSKLDFEKIAKWNLPARCIDKNDYSTFLSSFPGSTFLVAKSIKGQF